MVLSWAPVYLGTSLPGGLGVQGAAGSTLTLSSLPRGCKAMFPGYVISSQTSYGHINRNVFVIVAKREPLGKYDGAETFDNWKLLPLQNGITLPLSHLNLDPVLYVMNPYSNGYISVAISVQRGYIYQ